MATVRALSALITRMVVQSDGVIGAWISVLTEEKLAGMIRHMFRMIDALVIDHVGISSDLPAGVAATEMPDFSRHPELAAALRDHGLDQDEVDRVCAGNWLRVLRAVQA